MTVTSDARRQPVDAMGRDRRSKRPPRSAPDPHRRPGQTRPACRWAREWVDRLTPQNRAQAMLRARRLLGACLAADGRTAEAKAVIAGVAAQCAVADAALPGRWRSARGGHVRRYAPLNWPDNGTRIGRVPAVLPAINAGTANGFDIDTAGQNIRSGPPAPPIRVPELCRPLAQTH